MKTIKIKFSDSHAEEIAKLLYSLDIPILMSWSSEDFGDFEIFCIIKMDVQSGIPEALRYEKLRENRFIKVLNK